MDNKEINKYLRKVKSLIICDFATKRKFIGDLKNNILDCVETGSVKSIVDIHKQFGTPEDIAKAFFENADIVKINKKMSITRIILIAVIIALALWAGGIVTAVIDNHNTKFGYVITSSYYVDENGNPISEPETKIFYNENEDWN